MPGSDQAPTWFATALLGAVIAALGYVSKLLIETVAYWRRARAERRAQLLQLASLLRASRAAFVTQNELAKRLTRQLLDRHKPDELQVAGYEALITHFYSRFNEAEQDLHHIIRSLTQNAIRPLNASLSEWLRHDRDFRTSRYSESVSGRLAAELNQLDVHLTLWHAKYEAWMTDPRHALIYLADEQDHGVRFPQGLDHAVEKMLQDMGMSTESKASYLYGDSALARASSRHPA